MLSKPRVSLRNAIFWDLWIFVVVVVVIVVVVVFALPCLFI